MSKSANSSSGISLLGIVFIIFLILKLIEVGPVSNWSWWWVTAPLWGPFALYIGGVIFIFIIRFFVKTFF